EHGDLIHVGDERSVAILAVDVVEEPLGGLCANARRADDRDDAESCANQSGHQKKPAKCGSPQLRGDDASGERGGPRLTNVERHDALRTLANHTRRVVVAGAERDERRVAVADRPAVDLQKYVASTQAAPSPVRL